MSKVDIVDINITDSRLYDILNRRVYWSIHCAPCYILYGMFMNTSYNCATCYYYGCCGEVCK